MPRGKQEPPTAFTLAIHAEIRSWAGRRNISQRKLSELTGIGRSQLSKIIGTDEQPIDTNELEALCNVLGVSPNKLVDDAVKAVMQDQYRLAAETDNQPDLPEGEMY